MKPQHKDSVESVLRLEIWYQNSEEPDLWFGEHGVMVNSAALQEREAFFQLIRVRHYPDQKKQAAGLHL